MEREIRGGQRAERAVYNSTHPCTQTIHSQNIFAIPTRRRSFWLYCKDMYRSPGADQDFVSSGSLRTIL